MPLYVKLINFKPMYSEADNTIRLKNESSQGRGGGNIMKRNFGKTTGRRLWKYDARDDNRRVYRVG